MGKLRQSCTACSLAFAADEKYLGKAVRCPKCGQPVIIVDSGEAAPSSVMHRQPPSSKAPSTVASAKPPARPPSKPAAKPAAPAAAMPKAKPPAAAPAKPAPAKPAPAAPVIAVGVPGGAPDASLAKRVRRKTSTAAVVLGVVLIGGSVMAILLAVGALAFFSGVFDSEPAVVAAGDDFSASPSAPASGPGASTSRPSPSSGGQAAPDRNRPQERPSGFGRPGQNWSVFVLDLNDRDRGEVSVTIDGQPHTVPELGPIMYSLEEGEHQVTLTRPGYEPVQHAFYLQESGREVYRPFWQREGAGSVASLPRPIGGGQMNFDDWLQDFETAKRQAAAQNKDILIAFNGTDWCGWCIRLMHEVYFQPEFRRRIEQHFVLVHIDQPRNPPALQKVENRQRNQQMIRRFDISGYPTVVLTDSQGQAYTEGGYVEGGVPAFMMAIGEMKQERIRRDRLFEAVAASSGAQRVAAAQEALAWMRDAGVIQHYGPTLSAWLETARQSDPANEQGEYETFFELDWLARIASSDRSSLQALRPILARLDQFNREHQFVDGDRGGRLNLLAATFLAMHEQFDDALKYAQAGLDCEPQDAEVLATLQRATRALENSDVLATGTGFVVAAGGYILTNYHVVEEGMPYIRLPGEENPVPARVLASDKRKDIALLKLNDAATADFAPLPVSADSVGRGAKVAVFGYPLSDAVGTGLKLTTGGIGALPDAANEGMLLLDCRVNPGNSGGPLCDTRGRVIGMVTAKSDVGFGVDSYGMAQPGPVLEEFLKNHLPSYQPPAADATQPLEWEEVDRRVSGSVLMIVMKEK